MCKSKYKIFKHMGVEFLDVVGGTETSPVSDSPEVGGSVAHDFKCGVLWFEKEMLDYLQAVDWVELESQVIVDQMALLVNRIVK